MTRKDSYDRNLVEFAITEELQGADQVVVRSEVDRLAVHEVVREDEVSDIGQLFVGFEISERHQTCEFALLILENHVGFAMFTGDGSYFE